MNQERKRHMLPDEKQKLPDCGWYDSAGTVPKISPTPSSSAVSCDVPGTLTVRLPLPAFLLDTQHDVLLVRLNSVHGRLAARMVAYSIQAQDPEGAKAIFEVVGREG